MSEVPCIALKGLSKRFSPLGALVLDSVDLDVAPGEFVTLLGASGCGKSTMLNLIAGLERPTSGSIAAPKVAFMFQDASLFPWLSAQGNVELALELRGVPRLRRSSEAARLLDTVHLGDAAHKKPHELSGGMRQRVALARSLAQDREALLMDEPFASLDAITRDLLHEELLRVWRETGRTIIFITHNVREAVLLGQRVLLMSSRPGRVVGEWSTVGQDAGVLTTHITAELRKEIRRHAS
jgi:NitT/TauT family transport system ATP-binding protein